MKHIPMNNFPTRRSVFETNSSSSHSISVVDGIDFEVPKIDSPEIIIEAGGFGWSLETLNTWEQRASYAYTYAKNDGRTRDIETLKEVIEEFTGKKVIFSTSTEGYIDHQSTDTAERIFESPEMVKRVIFGKGSTIEIDNDNH